MERHVSRVTELISGEDGELNEAGLEDFTNSVKLHERGISYFVVSIIGPHNSGKSSLLNQLFGTSFKQRDRNTEWGVPVTRGVWIAKAAGEEPFTLVLDLEGADSLLRGQGKKILLLDNSNTADDEFLCIKYGVIPATLVQLFCDYLESHKLGLKAMAMRRIPIDRMKPHWRNNCNKVGCAMYAMRHMEVYIGQTVKDWDIDMKEDLRKQLLCLRVKYCRVLLTCEINIFRVQNLEEAKATYDKTCVSNFV